MGTDKKDDTKVSFLLEILTDMESLKNLIYNGSDVAAYRNLQKMSDKIKTEIRSELIEDSKNAKKDR
jgi:hypothetical protein